MLTVYSAHGSPGASTTAMYLAAHWASTGTEVVLIEADPGGGSLSHHLGIQFTPGAASFVASGLPVRGGNLIEHSQDVLFNNLHVMPATSSPTGAREIARCWEGQARELREVAETEMAVIVDAGRITADSASAALSAHAAGVVVVARGDSSPTTLQHLGALLSAEACGAGVHRSAVTVGDSALSAEEWAEQCDLAFAGAIKHFSEVSGDLSAFLNRNKRKSKRWRLSLEDAAAELLPYAKPAPGGASRRAAAADEGAAPAHHVVESVPEHASAPEPTAVPPAAAPAPEPAAAPPEPEPVAAAPPHGAYAAAPPEVPVEAAAGAPVEAGAPSGESFEQAAAYGPPPETHYAPAPGGDPHYAPPPPAAEPYYATEPPAPEGDPRYLPAAPPSPPFAGAPSHPAAPPAAAPHDVAPTWQPPPQPGAFQADLPPPFHQDGPPAGWAQQPPPPVSEPPAPPPVSEPPAPPPVYYPEANYGARPLESEPPPAIPPAYDPQPAAPAAHQPPGADYPPRAAAAPPADPYLPPPQQPAAPPQQPAPEPPAAQPEPPAAQPEPAELAPSGSFRDWAERLHKDIPNESSTSGHGGAS